jgi:hypothetical protein
MEWTDFETSETWDLAGCGHSNIKTTNVEGSDAVAANGGAARPGDVPTNVALMASLRSPAEWQWEGASTDILAGQGITFEDLGLLKKHGRMAMQEGRWSLYLSLPRANAVLAASGLDLRHLNRITLFFDAATGRVSARRYAGGGDPNLSDRHIGGHVLSDHAIRRLHARSFTHEHIRAALEHGEHRWAKGASKYILTQRQVRAAAERGIDVSAYEGITVVVAPPETQASAVARAVILTVFANGDLSHARKVKVYHCRDGRFRRPRRSRLAGRRW